MRELNIKFPIPDNLIKLYADSEKVSEADAAKHFEDLFQNMINILLPSLMKKMDEMIK